MCASYLICVLNIHQLLLPALLPVPTTTPYSSPYLLLPYPTHPIIFSLGAGGVQYGIRGGGGGGGGGAWAGRATGAAAQGSRELYSAHKVEYLIIKSRKNALISVMRYKANCQGFVANVGMLVFGESISSYQFGLSLSRPPLPLLPRLHLDHRKGDPLTFGLWQGGPPRLVAQGPQKSINLALEVYILSVYVVPCALYNLHVLHLAYLSLKCST